MNEQNEYGASERGRVFSIERGLLVAILGMQVVIAWGLFRNASDGAESVDARVAAVNAAAVESGDYAPVRRYPPVPVSFPQPALFGDVDAMFADALENMARLRSAMHIDEGWDVLAASPTMDMRDEDAGYLVSFSIPGAHASDIEVSLDGRVLTVQAMAPVRGPHHTRLQRFERRVLLPGPIGGVEDAHACITNGVLSVRVPKGQGAPDLQGSLRLF
jgi:HSP20 family molecular chaperone IbpA